MPPPCAVLNPMRALLPALFLLLTAPPVFAEPAKAPPHHALAKSIGKFGAWQAATHPEDDATTCYAFTRAEAPPQKILGRGDVVLSVTRRGKSHDVVAISAGFALSGHEDAPLLAGSTKMLFYIDKRSAFARDNAAAIAVFGHELSVAAKLVGPRGMAATDHFSLKGFNAAYAAMAKACPVS